MSELYAAESAQLAAESGMKFARLVPTEGPHGVHAVDAGLTCLREVNALTRHSDDERPPMMMSQSFVCPDEQDACVARIEECCTKLEGGDVSEGDLPNEVKEMGMGFSPKIMLLLQLAALIKKLMS